MSQQDNLEYVKQILLRSRAPNSYPSIYFLWGCIVFVGYAVAEFHLPWATIYWLIATPLGMVASAWLGIRSDKSLGQVDSHTGEHYLYHFGLLVAFIFLAIFTEEYQSILLLIGLGYGIAGIYLDRMMLVVALLASSLHIAIHFGFVTSQLMVGAVFALGFFATAWGAAKSNAEAVRSQQQA